MLLPGYFRIYWSNGRYLVEVCGHVVVEFCARLHAEDWIDTCFRTDLCAAEFDGIFDSKEW